MRTHLYVLYAQQLVIVAYVHIAMLQQIETAVVQVPVYGGRRRSAHLTLQVHRTVHYDLS